MDDYQTYIQSGGDDQSTGGGGNRGSGGSGCGNVGCGTIVWIILGIVFLIFWYSHGGT